MNHARMALVPLAHDGDTPEDRPQETIAFTRISEATLQEVLGDSC